MFNQYVMNKYMFRVLFVIDSLIFQPQCQMCKILQDNNMIFRFRGNKVEIVFPIFKCNSKMVLGYNYYITTDTWGKTTYCNLQSEKIHYLFTTQTAC